MDYNWIKLPLYDSWDYEYNVTVDSVNLGFRIFYSDRTKSWSIDLSYADGESIVEGERIVPFRPIMDDKVKGISGFMWLEPISSEQPNINAYPDQIHRYYNLYFIYI